MFRRGKIDQLSDLRAAYDSYYSAGQGVSDAKFNLRVVGYLNRVKPMTEDCWLIDIGCGAGYFLEHGESRVRTVGIELSRNALLRCKTRLCRTHLIQATAEQLPFRSELFDFCTLLGVLEHVSNMENALDELYRVLKKDGVVCLIVPNARSLFEMFQKHDESKERVLERFATAREWTQLFCAHGLRVLRLYPCRGTSLRNIVKNMQALKLLTAIILILEIILPAELCWQHTFICQKMSKP